MYSIILHTIFTNIKIRIIKLISVLLAFGLSGLTKVVNLATTDKLVNPYLTPPHFLFFNSLMILLYVVLIQLNGQREEMCNHFHTFLKLRKSLIAYSNMASKPINTRLITHTKILCIASYYRQFTTNIRIEIIKLISFC